MAHPHRTALQHKNDSLNYEELATAVEQVAAGLLELGLSTNERVAVYLPKQFESVIAFFAASLAGAVFVPVNPLLKAEQVAYILKDCNVRVLITSSQRALQLSDALRDCHDLRDLVLVDDRQDLTAEDHYQLSHWPTLLAASPRRGHRRIDMDMAAILYTSGSTGKPKGVVLSHRNMVTGAHSVAEYLRNHADDRLLAVLPFSFDYGFSQLTTAFSVGAQVVLLEYLLPRDVVRAIERYGITGLAGVPPLWNQLAQLDWPEAVKQCLRYTTNSGGAMPIATLDRLRAHLPQTDCYLMYGLTEAFRSTYLPPSELARRPDSMGKAIPNAEVMVVREDGSPCAVGEPGELVHRGSLVAMGYWNDAEKTAERFRPAPSTQPGIMLEETAVWSGDTVRQDEEGYLYFVGRKDDMIKTSGYRVSPTELEEVIYSSGLVTDAVALGLPHPTLGQAIAIIASGKSPDEAAIINLCKQKLPAFMVPQHVEFREQLPRNPNGKIDRKTLAAELVGLFAETTA